MTNYLRTYNMSDAALFALTNKIYIAAKRDKDELALYNIDEAAIDNLDTKAEALANTPTDMELSGMMVGVTEQKKAKRNQISDYIMVEIMIRASLVMDTESPNYKRFGVSNMRNETDGDFFILMKRVRRQAIKNQALLATKGLTADHLDQLSAFIIEFENLWEAQDAAIDDRDEAVQARTEAGNSLYADIVIISELCKGIWGRLNDSKFNDYVIYPNQNKAPNSQELETEVPVGKVVSLSVSYIKGKSKLEATNLGDNDLIVYFSQYPIQLPQNSDSETIGYITTGDTLKCTAKEIGFLPVKSRFMNVYNPGPNAGKLSLSVR